MPRRRARSSRPVDGGRVPRVFDREALRVLSLAWRGGVAPAHVGAGSESDVALDLGAERGRERGGGGAGSSGKSPRLTCAFCSLSSGGAAREVRQVPALDVQSETQVRSVPANAAAAKSAWMGVASPRGGWRWLSWRPCRWGSA